MDFIQALNLASTGEILIMVAINYAVNQAIKQGNFHNKYMPWISMAVGAVIGVVAMLVSKDSNYLGGAITGLLVGGFTSGLFDGFKGLSKTAFGTTAPEQVDPPKTAELNKPTATPMGATEYKGNDADGH
ncbi:MAG: hypothetical protein LKF36_12010 [Lactobacillus sp.]|jgi:hypothetical protein|nr:hypothetical protein [Lactobacillus sp.]